MIPQIREVKQAESEKPREWVLIRGVRRYPTVFASGIHKVEQARAGSQTISDRGGRSSREIG